MLQSRAERPGWRRPLLQSLSIGVALLLGLWLAAPPLALTVENGEEEFLRWPLRPGEPFAIHYIHSVDRLPVIEVFTAQVPGAIHVQESHFQNLGAGLGQVNGQGRWVEDPPWTRILDLNRPVGSIALRVGWVANHQLQLGSRSVPLDRLSPAGSAVALHVRSAGPWRLLTWLRDPSDSISVGE